MALRIGSCRSCFVATLAIFMLAAGWMRGGVFAAEDKAQAADSKAAENDGRYVIQEDHDPNGIGKFYLGREIAQVMGFGAADWLERPMREQEEGLSKLIAALKLKPGMVVADIGAGSGRISLLMAEQVGENGKVLAVDVQEEMLALLSKKLDEQKVKNIEPVLGTPKSPKLKPNSIDLALMVDVYHELEFPYEMLSEIAKSLKPEGRVVFVEYRKEDPNVRTMIKVVHTMTEAQVKKEASVPELGLKWKETVEVLPVQHIIIFARGGDPKSTPSADQSSTNSKQ